MSVLQQAEQIVSGQHGSRMHAAHWRLAAAMVGERTGETTEMVLSTMHCKHVATIPVTALSHVGHVHRADNFQEFTQDAGVNSFCSSRPVLRPNMNSMTIVLCWLALWFY